MKTNQSKGLLNILGNSMTGVNKYDKLSFCGHGVPRKCENNGLIILTLENTVEPLNSGHHWFSKKVSAIARCPL